MHKILILFFLVSCASAPSHEEMKKAIAGFNLPGAPDKGEGVIYVVRPSSIGAAVRFNVFLDNEEDASEMGWNRGGQYVYFYAKPGEHKIYSDAENTADMMVTVKEGEPVFIQQQAEMGLLYARNSIAKVDEVTGTYYVKSLERGKFIRARKTPVADSLHK